MVVKSSSERDSVVTEKTLVREKPNVHRVERRTTRSRRETRLRIGVISILAAAICAAAAAWLLHQARSIHDELLAARALVPQFQSALLNQDENLAREVLDQITEHTHAARVSSSDPLWAAASVVPWIGPNFAATSEIAQSADDVALRAADPLLKSARSLDWKLLFPGDGSIDPTALAEASPSIVAAATTVGLTHDRLAGIDRSQLLPAISGPLEEVVDSLDGLNRDLSLAGDIAEIVPGMLGEDTPRNYLILIQNSAEVRATGGLPGALAVLTSDKGQLKLSAQSTGAALNKFTPPVSIDAEQATIYSARLGTYIGDVNLTPDFPTAASTAKKMWELRHTEKIDGVVAIDPVVLAHILEASGPVTFKSSASAPLSPGLPEVLTAENVVSTLLSDVYTVLESNEAQDSYFAAVSEEIFGVLTSGRTSGRSLLQAVSRSFEENRIRVWSDHKEDQEVLGARVLGGSTSGPSVGGASFGVYFNDGTGAKMDYYMRHSVQLVKACPRNGYAEYRVRVGLTNTAPINAAEVLPPAVTGAGKFGTPPGFVQTNIVVYGPAQSHADTATAAGSKVSFGSHLHGQRPVGVVTTRLAPGQSTQVEMTFVKVVQNAPASVTVTPTVQPVKDVTLPTEIESCQDQ